MGSAPQSSAEADAERAVARALDDAARVRELEAKAPVKSVVISRRDMEKKVRDSIQREIPGEVVRAEGDMLIAFGVVPPNFDYVETTVELMTAELAGYYEPLDKTMYLAADLGAEERQATLAHELVHALEDQHYDLKPILDYRPDASDIQSAVHALAEGDAMSAMLDELLEPQGKRAIDLPESLIAIQARAAAQFSKSTKDVPDVLKRSLIAPYVDGLAFVHFLRRRGGWKEVDRAWEHLPESTEQVLHPEKFLAHEAPLVVDIPEPPPGGPSTVALHDVVGEQTLRELFEEWLPRQPAASAAADWGGDRVAVFHEDDRVAVAMHVRYDSDAAAGRGFAATRKGIEAAAAGSTRNTKTSECAERADRGPFLTAERNRDVVVVAGPYRLREGGPSSASSCQAAAAWAARILGQR